jgi:hypothetical protein
MRCKSNQKALSTNQIVTLNLYIYNNFEKKIEHLQNILLLKILLILLKKQ